MPAGAWPPRRIGIVGVGLLGQSVALAARRAWPGVEILGVDRPDISGNLTAPSCVDRWAGLSDVIDCDLVMLAAPVTENETALAALSSAGCRALVTDVGSTKRGLARVADALPGSMRVVGGHPMAGNETGVPSAGLFKSRTWFVVPFRDSRAEDVARVEEMAKALGAEPASIDADAHDFLMAAISHVPQLVASALMQSVGERVGQGGLQHAGRGLADTTRLASCAGDWVTDVMASNADNVGPALDDLIAKLQAARSHLSSREVTGRLLAEARSWRAFVRS